MTFQRGDAGALPYRSRFFGRSVEIRSAVHMVLYKPRTWCAFCPMGTMTQGICKLKNKE